MIDKTQANHKPTQIPQTAAIFFLATLLLIGVGVILAYWQTYKTLTQLQTQTDTFHAAILKTLPTRQATLQTDWALAEIDHLLQTAQYTLLFEKNSDLATKLLTTALARVDALNNPRLARLHQSLTDTIKQLEAVPLLDREALVEKINTLSEKVNALSPIPRSSAPQKRAQPVATPKSWRQRFSNGLAAIGAEIHQLANALIVIRHHESRENTLILTTIQLQLSQAAWAVLQAKSTLYQQSLRTTEKLLKRYHPDDTTSVTEIVSEVTQLASIDINPKLPSIAPALSRLQVLRTNNK